MKNNPDPLYFFVTQMYTLNDEGYDANSDIEDVNDFLQSENDDEEIAYSSKEEY